MTRDWLTASGIERTSLVLSAINTLSIAAKLRLAAMDVPVEATELEEARSYLSAFLAKLEALIKDAERSQDGVILGADPQLGDLAVKFLTEKRRPSPHSTVYTLPVAEFIRLLQTEEPEGLTLLIGHLRELRGLIERGSHADINHILGDL